MTRYWSATVRWYRWSSSLYRRTGQCEEAHEHLTTATTMHRELDMRFWLTRSPRLPLRLAPPRPPTRRRRLRPRLLPHDHLAAADRERRAALVAPAHDLLDRLLVLAQVADIGLVAFVVA